MNQKGQMPDQSPTQPAHLRPSAPVVDYAGPGLRQDRLGRFLESRSWHILKGLFYLALGALFLPVAALLAFSPVRIFTPGEPHYPNFCQLTCPDSATVIRAPDGSWHCEAHPPRDTLDARMGLPAKWTRLIAGFLLGVAGIPFALATPICGAIWLRGRWVAPPRTCLSLLYHTAPLIAIVLWISATIVKAIYPLPPKL